MILIPPLAVMSSAAGIGVAGYAYHLADAASGSDPMGYIVPGGVAAVLIWVLGLVMTGRLYTTSHVKHLLGQIQRQERVIDRKDEIIAAKDEQIATLIRVGHEGTVPLLRNATQAVAARTVDAGRIEQLIARLEADTDRREIEGETS